MCLYRSGIFCALAAGLVLASPAAAQASGSPAAAEPGYDRAAYENARADWLTVCRHNQRSSGNDRASRKMLGGMSGNRTTGRGHRVLSTAFPRESAGTTMGQAHDYCEAYLNSYPQPAMTAPMAAQPQQAPCTETTVTEEWVTDPARPQTIPRPAPPRRLPDKRIQQP